MYKKNLIIAGSIALSLHAAVVMMMPEVTSEPKVIFRKGESSLKMNLVPSVASTASIKSINTQKNVQKVEEKKIDNPQPVKKPQIIEKGQIKVEEKIVQETKEITYSAEYFKTQNEIKTKQPQIQKNNTATQDSKEIIADVKVKGVTMGAMVKNVFKPSYPSSCKRLGHEGATVLKVTILSKGKCGSIEIIKSAGCESLDKAAIKALKKAKYIPAKRLGIPFTTTKKLAFNFKLEDYK
ncbi:MAG: energy transducer TonB [Candidatus Scalindua sp.]|jgi:protein TonB|nr:energy transducer TonB [Candidatus Scalindua sp.]